MSGRVYARLALGLVSSSCVVAQVMAQTPAVPSVVGGGTPAVPKVTVTPAAPSASTRPTGEAARQKNLDALFDQARAALSLNDFKAARDGFADVLTLDPRNAAALSGQTYAYLKLDDFAHARAAVDRAVTVPGPSKQMVMNASAVFLKSKTPMRGAKLLRDYLTAHQNPVDEDVLNALGTSLTQADDTTKALTFFEETVRFYESMNAKLEATRSGEKRWGSTWLPAAEGQRKNDAYRAALAEIRKEAGAMAQAKSNFDVTQANKDRALANARKMRRSVSTFGYDNDMAEYDRQYRAASAKREALLAKLDRPPFPSEIAVVEPDLGTATVAVASAAAAAGTPAAAPSATDTSAKTGPDKLPAWVPPKLNGPSPTFNPGSSSSSDNSSSSSSAGSVTPAPAPKKLYITNYAAAFAVGPDVLVTSAVAVEGAQTLTVQGTDGNPMNAEVVSTDTGSGLALIRVPGKRLAYLSLADKFAGGGVTSVGFPTVNLFDPVAEAITGGATAPTGSDKWTIKLNKHPRLPGGPLLSSDNKVIGVQLATRDSEIAQVPAATLADLKKLLAGQAASAPGTANPQAATMQLTAVRQKRGG